MFDDDDYITDIELPWFEEEDYDEWIPVCSVCEKPITFLDFAKYGKCKECRDHHD